ncbi:MAG: right-handed parallel beta-helix repeat-containing protein [Cystobacter sp.]
MRISRLVKIVSPLAVMGMLSSAPAVLAASEGAPSGAASLESLLSASATPAFSRILWVSPSGQDTAAGTEATPYRTVAKALSQVKPGEAIYLKSGTYSERMKLEEKGGTSSLPLTLKAAPGAKPVFKGGTGSRTPMLDVRGAYWSVEGLTFDAAGDKAFVAFWRGEGAHHGVLRGCTLKNGTEGAGVYVAQKARDILIEGNTISHFNRAGDDSHGVCVQTNSKNVTVRANDIHHNSGDGVQCLGPEGGATEAGTPFDNLLVEGNDLHENQENGADIKTCTRVTLRGNRIWGHRRTPSSAGEGVVVHMSARDVTLEDNEVRDNGRGIQIGGVREGAPPTRIVVRRNRVFNGYGGETNDGSAIRVDTAIDVKVDHNTVWNMPAYGVIVGNSETGPSQGVRVRNNLLGACSVAAVRLGTAIQDTSFDGNLYTSTKGAAVLRRGSSSLNFTAWRSATGWDARGMEQTPSFLGSSSSVAAEDFWLAPTSPGLNAGVSVGDTHCGKGPDIGARESDCS